MLQETSEFTADLDRRFGGLVRLYGSAGAQRIRAAHIVVVGLGGVGSWAAEAFARSGVARLTLIDLDHIAESNINRQVHALETTLGQAKVQAMRSRIADINPECRVDCIEEFVDEQNWPDILALDSMVDHKQFAVVDACDQVMAKTAMAAWAVKNGISFVTVGAAGGKRLAHQVEIEDISKITHDPLMAKMRYYLRKNHEFSRVGKMNVFGVFSRERVATPSLISTQSNNHQDNLETHQIQQPGQDSASDGSLNCHGYGSVVSVTSTFGMCAASWVLNKITQ